jgi:hypothetical protein
MQLEDYVRDALATREHPTGFPDDLILSEKLVVALFALFVAGEQEGREYGCNLTYRETEHELIQSMLYVGDMNSCPIEPMAHPANCADAHCHPAASIGDVGGYSPHSMEDFLSLGDQRHKPVFIRFVVSGDRIYAVVYRNGLTRYDAEGIYEVNRGLKAALDDYMEAHCPVGLEERTETLSRAQVEASRRNEDPGAASERMMIEYKRRTPGLGEHTAEVTTKACRKVASRFAFGFYERTSTFALTRVK